MISAREFCREQEYPITVFLSYAFDPLFFERVPWSDLSVGGSRRIIIVADGAQVTDSIRRCLDQVVHLGRRYVLAETVVSNTFHPKLIARLSEKGGRIWIGSGNLTYTGWGGNREVATSWAIGPEEDDKGIWLDETLNAVSKFVRSTTFSDSLRAIRDEVTWLTQGPPGRNDARVMLGLPDRPLAPQLAERWRGRRFEDLKLCTGSTDTDGAFLSWAHRTFGIKRATICLNPAFSSFDPRKLTKLPLDVRFVEETAQKLMHAKFYWFSGPDGDGAVMGSANCSTAAWLLGGGNGNVELMTVYDQPDAPMFEKILAVFERPLKTPLEALPLKAMGLSDDTYIPQMPYRLTSVRLRSFRIIEALVEPSVPASARVNLTVRGGSVTTTIKLASHTRGLTGHLPIDFDPGLTTNFAFADVILDGNHFRTSARWVDNDVLLYRTSNPRRLDPTLRDLSRYGPFASDQQRILQAVQELSDQLLTGRSDHLTANVRFAGTKAAKSTTAADAGAARPAPAIDPTTMIRSLKDLRLAQQGIQIGRFSYVDMTLDGVISLLFAENEESDLDLNREKWTATEPEKDQDDIPLIDDNSRLTLGEQPVSMQATSSETLSRFQKQISSFLSELAKLEFAETCDAKRMEQALAFPLLLCVRGSEAGWLAPTQLSSTAARVVEIMLSHHYGGAKPLGLLRMVQSRYAHLGRGDDFRRVIGEGTLWAALLASLGEIPTTPLRIVIRQAAALAATFECKELLEVADASHVLVLVRNLLIKNAEANVTERAANIAGAMAELTNTLTVYFEEIYKEQGRGRSLQRAESILWSPNWGWKITPNAPAEAYYTDFINLERGAVGRPAIVGAIKRVIISCK